MQLVSVNKIRSILERNVTVAVVGLSPKPNRPSHQVASYLQENGYHIIPVNPGQNEILGEQCYPDLNAIPGPVDIVNIFRRPEHVLSIVRDAIAKKVKVIWMQEGIINEEAARLAEHKGLLVIMDRCLKVDHQSFMK